MDNHQQLLLAFTHDEDLTFDNFFSTKDLNMIVSTLKQKIESQTTDFILISGEGVTGKTHLLKAACLWAFHNNIKSVYLPLKDLISYHPHEVLKDLDQFFLLCIDDCDLVKANADWQEALFGLYNHRLDQGQPVFFSTQKPANQSGFTLLDLQSRLSACLGFHLRVLNDEERHLFLQFKSYKKGMDLTDQCADYIIRRYDRNLKNLNSIVEKLSLASLRQRRKLTVPFIKSLLG